IVAILQSSAVMNLLSLTSMQIRPDIFLILLVYFAINGDSYDAVITSFAIGFAADIAGMVMGPHIISYGLIGTALAHIRKIILLKKTNQQALTIFITGILAESAAMLLMDLKASGLSKAGVFEIFAVSVYSAILWFMIKWPVVTIGKWIGVGVFRFGARTSGRQ
ncbi:MAG: rod shape-determining protein MreD, partial [Phycisphaerae bacterium]|nr:rod shape-determining protein MreD [Phycisphaerae bacterium]